MPKLLYRPGQPDERSFTLGSAPVVIGRADEHAISIQDKSLSRSHARVEPQGDAFFVVDLGSKNGTFVNGERVDRRELRPGDTLVLGDIAFFFGDSVPPNDASTPLVGGPSLRAVRSLGRVPIARLTSDAAQRAPDRLRMLLEAAKLLSGREDVDALSKRTLDLAFQMLDVDRGAVLLVDEHTGRLLPRVTRTRHPEHGSPAEYSQRIVDYVLANNVAAVFGDPTADPRLAEGPSVHAPPICASLCVPLKPRDEVIGVLYLDNMSHAGAFPEDDLEFLVAFASLAAIAMENAALYRRVERETVERMALVMDAKLASLNALLAGIAHELRNPLNLVANFAELSSGLLDELGEGLARQRDRIPDDASRELDDALSALRDNAVRVNENGRKADAILKAMLSHARPSAGEREDVDVNALVTESVKMALLGRHRLAGVEVTLDEDPAAGTAAMARGDVSRVLTNVVENALHAMGQKQRKAGASYAPRLVVRTVALGEHVQVRIRDNGTGIAPEIADRIYDPFFTTKPPGEGTGLGLSLGHDIVVRGHQGSMRMDSIPGEHCEMVITLPRRGLPRRG